MLGILFAVIISVFAFDVFSAGYGVLETIFALLIHLIPTIAIIFALVIVLRRVRVGSVIFISFAILFLAMSRGDGWVI